jgi:hypothetical protein
MQYSHLLMGVIVISSNSVFLSAMSVQKKKQKAIVEIVRVPVTVNESQLAGRQLRDDQKHLLAFLVENNDQFALLRPRL